MSETTIKARAWCITLFDLNQEQELCDLIDVDKDFLSYQHEICPTTSAEHIQAFVYFKTQARLSKIKRALPTAHIEVAKNIKGAYLYTKKEESAISGSFKELGVKPRDLKDGAEKTDRKADLKKLYYMAKERARIEDVESAGLEHYLVTHRHLTASFRQEERMGEFHCIYIWGSTNAGKSHAAEKYARLFSHSTQGGIIRWAGGKWISPHTSKDIMILSDIDTEMVKQLGLGWFKNLIDGTPQMAEDKGTRFNILCRNFIITSNYPPQTVWNNDAAMMRRMKQIEECNTYAENDQLCVRLGIPTGALTATQLLEIQTHGAVQQTSTATLQTPTTFSPMETTWDPTSGVIDLNALLEECDYE